MSHPSSRQSSQEILYQGLVSSAKITRRTHALIQKELAAMKAELVGRPSDSFSNNPSFHVRIGPADRAGMLGIGPNVSH